MFCRINVTSFIPHDYFREVLSEIGNKNKRIMIYLQ